MTEKKREVSCVDMGFGEGIEYQEGNSLEKYQYEVQFIMNYILH